MVKVKVANSFGRGCSPERYEPETAAPHKILESSSTEEN